MCKHNVAILRLISLRYLLNERISKVQLLQNWYSASFHVFMIHENFLQDISFNCFQSFAVCQLKVHFRLQYTILSLESSTFVNHFSKTLGWDGNELVAWCWYWYFQIWWQLSMSANCGGIKRLMWCCCPDLLDICHANCWTLGAMSETCLHFS